MVDARPTSSLRKSVSYDLFGEHVEVQCKLPVPGSCPECRHVTHDHLARAIHRLPSGKDQVRIGITHITLMILFLMLSLRMYPEVEKASSYVFCRHRYGIVLFEVGMHPTVSMGRMGVMAVLHQAQNLNAVLRRFAPSLLPFVVARATHLADVTEFDYGIFLRESFDDGVLFSDTGTNSPGIPSSLGIRV